MVRHLRLVTLLFVVTGLAVSGGSLFGQSAPIADEFKDLHFRSIGPASMSGRITDFAVYEANPAIYYVASAHGGVWKTTSAGAMYEPQLQDMGPMSMGAVAVSQKDPNVAFAGGGESNNRQSSSWGDGIYKTTDGGKTWRNVGLRNSKHIGRIVIDPTDHNIAETIRRIQEGDRHEYTPDRLAGGVDCRTREAAREGEGAHAGRRRASRRATPDAVDGR